MDHYYFPILWSYLAIISIVEPACCVFIYLAVAQAAKRRLPAYLKWLIPFAIGLTMTAAAALSMSLSSAMQLPHREMGAFFALSYIFSTIGFIMILYGIVALYRMVKTLPPYQRPTETFNHPPDSQIWPPAPNRP